MPSITYYAIRHKTLGTYFMQGSNTKYDPVDPDQTPLTIRLFRHERNAKSALARWCEGKWFNSHEDGMEVEPVKGRTKDAYEIIPITLEL